MDREALPAIRHDDEKNAVADYAAGKQHGQARPNQAPQRIEGAMVEILGNEAHSGGRETKTQQTRGCRCRTFEQAVGPKTASAELARDKDLQRQADREREQISDEHIECLPTQSTGNARTRCRHGARLLARGQRVRHEVPTRRRRCVNVGAQNQSSFAAFQESTSDLVLAKRNRGNSSSKSFSSL